MEGSQEFNYKLAPFRGSIQFRVEPERVERLDESGRTAAELDLAKVKSARYMEMYVKQTGMMMRSLVLKTERGSFQIAISHRGRTPPNHADLVGYLSTVHATLRGLSTAQPHLKVAIGEHSAARWFNAALALGLGVFISWVLMQALDRTEASEFWWLYLILGACAAACFYGVWFVGPWRPQEEVPAASLATSLLAEVRPQA